jgi:hypothetical protein
VEAGRANVFTAFADGDTFTDRNTFTNGNANSDGDTFTDRDANSDGDAGGQFLCALHCGSGSSECDAYAYAYRDSYSTC